MAPRPKISDDERRKRNKLRKRTTRAVPNVKQQERDADRKAKADKRMDAELKQKVQGVNTQAKADKRKDADLREKERTADRIAKKDKRKDADVRQKKRTADRIGQEDKRKDPESKHKLQAAERKAKKLKRTSRTIEYNLTQFMSAKREGPDWKCESCGCLWFRGSVVRDKDTEGLVCRTCNESLKTGRVPRFSVCRGLKFPDIPAELQGLTVLEARFLALQLPFMQIRSLGGDRQCGIRGSAVHIPNELDDTVTVLPRTLDETRIIFVDFMRRMDHEKPYYSGKVRPAVVRRGAEFLMPTPLYRSEGAVLSSTWNLDESSDDTDTSLEPDSEETMLLNIEEFVLKMAPGQGKSPLSLLGDPHAEAKAYPDKWCGQFPPNLEDLKIGFAEYKKFQVRSADRRFTDSATLLHFYCLVLKYHIIKSQSTYGRKKKGKRMTAADMLDPEALNSLITHDFAFRIFKEVRTTPAYWEKKSKHILGMIRQLGIPNFFMTLSAAEAYWPELIVILKKTVDNVTISEEDVESINMEQRTALVRKDPVTCARYFEHRFHAAFNLLIKPSCGIFRPHRVVDYFCRTEFQHRGSPHVHMMLWIEGAPKFNQLSPDVEKECIMFLNTILSCKHDEEGVLHQQHKHTFTCRNKNRKEVRCRFNFPIPPMKETRIIQPILSCPELRISRRRKFNLLQDFLEDKMTHLDSWTFEDVLNNFNWSYEDYLGILQSGIKRTTVFLERRPADCFTNLYAKDLAQVWRSNMDLQMIFDPYGAAHYICSYITKSNAGISKLMKEVSDQMRGEHLNIKHKMRVIGKTFLNNVEISAQEAAYGILGLPLTNASRESLFIQTGKPEERIFLLKSEEELRNLCGESTDIGVSGMLEHYIMRPESFEDMCLADFAAWYTFSSKRRGQVEDLDVESVAHNEDEVHTRKAPFLPLTDHSGYIRRRTKQRIIRYRKYGEIEDPDNFCRENLMLFKPWRNETKELLEVDVMEEYKQASCDIIPRRLSYNMLQKELETVEPFEEVEDEENQLDEEYACMEGQQEKINLLNELLADTCQETVERIPLPHLTPFTEYKAMIRRLNKRQGQFLCHLMDQLAAGEVQPYFVYGGAGAGKSTLIDSIVQTVTRWVLKDPGANHSTCKVLLMAPTGMAAFNIKGTTIHSALKLPLSQFQGEMPALSMGVRNTLACTLQDCKLVVIDEISMVSSSQLYLISIRLQQIFNCPENFGGKQIVAFGDLRQLAPVEAPSIFSPLKGMVENTLWKSFRSYELTEVMRQKDDLKFAAALNNLARGSMTEEEITMFKGREVSRIGYPEGKCRRLYYQNAKVDSFNSRILSELTTKKMTFQAIDVIQGYGTEEAKRKLLDLVKGKPTKETSALPTHVNLVESAAYMLTRNLDTSDGLVNGAIGTLEKISCGENGSGQKIPTIAWIKYERADVGLKRRKTLKRLSDREQITKPWTPIQIEKTPVRCWKSSSLSCVRGQFPLVPAEASTIHKSQGSTQDRILVNVERLQRKALYVACSRAKTIAGLYLEGEFKPPSCKEDDKTEVEMGEVKSREILIPQYPDVVGFILSGISREDVLHVESEELDERNVDCVSSVRSKLSNLNIDEGPILHFSVDGVNVYEEDMLTLAPGEELSDSVVDGFFKILQRDPALDAVGRLYAFTTPFVRVLLDSAEALEGEFQEQIGIQVVIFPLCVHHHWKIAIATREDMKVRIYDSMDQSGHNGRDFLRTVTQFMNSLELRYDGNPVWEEEFDKPDIPQQTDCNSCGVFVCYYVEMLARGITIETQLPNDYRSRIQQALRCRIQ